MQTQTQRSEAVSSGAGCLHILPLELPLHPAAMTVTAALDTVTTTATTIEIQSQQA